MRLHDVSNNYGGTPGTFCCVPCVRQRTVTITQEYRLLLYERNPPMRTIMNIGARVKGMYNGCFYFGTVREQHFNGKEHYIVQLDEPIIIHTKRSALCIEIGAMSTDTIEMDLVYKK